MKKTLYILIAMLLMTSAASMAQKKDDANIEKSNTQMCMNTLNSWTKALNSRNLAQLEGLYSDIVLY